MVSLKIWLVLDAAKNILVNVIDKLIYIYSIDLPL